MAKGNTTGKPRKVRDTETVYRSKAETERYYEQIAIIGAAIVAGLVALVLIYALVNDYVVVPEQAITTAAGKKVKTKEFQERYRAERWYLANEIRTAYEESGGNEDLLGFYLQQTLAELPTTTDVLTLLQDDAAFGRYVLGNIELQALLEKEAEDRGIKIDEGEIQAQVDAYFTRYTGANLTPTDNPTETRVHTETPTPLITATASDTPTPTDIPTETPLPTVEGCAEGETCATVTPLPSNTPTPEVTPTETPAQTETPEPTNTPLDRDDVKATLDKFGNSYYDDADEKANVDRDAVRDIFYLRALRVALRDEIAKDIPNTAVWVDSRHILVQVPEGTFQGTEFDTALCETEPWLNAKAKIDPAYTALLAGEPFAALAQAVSEDGSASQGGALGWQDMDNGAFVDQYKEVARTANIGEILPPVCSQFGWHIIQVLDREIRIVNSSDLLNLKQTEYKTWEDALVAGADVERRDDWTDRIPDDPSYDDLLGDLFPSNVAP